MQVTFRPDIPYGLAKQKAEWQDKVVRNIGIAGTVVGLGLGLGLGFSALQRRL